MSDIPQQQGNSGPRTCNNCGAVLSPISRICASCGTLAGAPGPRGSWLPPDQPAEPSPPAEPAAAEQPESGGPPPGQPPQEPPSGPPDQPTEPPRRPCASCGSELGPEARFCPQCGAAAPLPAQPARQRFCTQCGAELPTEARFCSQCGVRVEAVAGTEAATFPPFPLIYEVEYPEKLSRLLIFVKWLLVIPQLLVVYALGQVSGLIAFLAFFCILFTKRYPRGLFTLVVGFNRWSANVTTYFSLLRDEYPPFSTDTGRYPVRYDVDYPETLSRWLIWVKWLLVLPHYLVLFVLAIVALPVFLISWFAILFTGKFPRGMFNFIVGITRWNLRLSAYTGLMRDEFPPYGLSADAKPGGWRTIVISLVIGFAAIAAMVAGVVALASISSGAKELPVRYDALLNGRATPLVSTGGTEVVLLDAEDPYDIVAGTRTPRPGDRYVAFVFNITNRDSLLTNVGEEAFLLEDTSGDKHRPRLVRRAGQFLPGFVEQGERAQVTVVFELGEFEDPARLTYSPLATFLPFGEKVRFLFR